MEINQFYKKFSYKVYDFMIRLILAFLRYNYKYTDIRFSKIQLCNLMNILHQRIDNTLNIELRMAKHEQRLFFSQVLYVMQEMLC